MSSIAITDHGMMHGVIDFYKACKKNDVNPIIGCLLAGQEIVTMNGVKNIEDINVGDFVLTHTGNWKPVTKTFKREYKGQLYNIQLGQNARPIYITEEHPILVTTRRKASKWNKDKFNQSEWLKPSDIKTGRVSTHCGIDSWNSYASLPKLPSYNKLNKIFPGNLLQQYGFIIENEHKIKRPKNIKNKYDSDKLWDFPTTLHLDEDLGRFLGLYAAEGSIAIQPEINGRICFTFNINEIEYSDFIVKVLKNKFSLNAKVYEKHEQSTREVVVCCLPLAYFLKHCCESGSHNKKVPQWMYHAPHHVRQAFCQGVLEGDGKNTNGTLKVSSRNLAWGMRTLMADQNYWGSITEGVQDNKYKHYMLNLATNRKYARTIELEDKILKPIQSITSQYVETTVYNIEVSEDNSYISDITMHNCEAYITEDEDGIEDNRNKTRDNYHCVLLAKNNDGLKTLYSLTNNATLFNFYYKPRISIHNLKRSDLSGLIATSSCLGGVVTKQGEFDEGNKTFRDVDSKAVKQLGLFKELFNNNFYAEIQDNPEFWQQQAYNDWLVKTSKQEGVPLIITSDAHFLTKEDKHLHNIVMAQQMKKTVEEYSCDEDGMAYGEGHYIRSPDEMLQAALKYNAEEAFFNTTEISKQCSIDITLGKYEVPYFDITQEEDYSEFKDWKEKRT